MELCLKESGPQDHLSPPSRYALPRLLQRLGPKFLTRMYASQNDARSLFDGVELYTVEAASPPYGSLFSSAAGTGAEPPLPPAHEGAHAGSAPPMSASNNNHEERTPPEDGSADVVSHSGPEVGGAEGGSGVLPPAAAADVAPPTPPADVDPGLRSVLETRAKLTGEAVDRTARALAAGCDIADVAALAEVDAGDVDDIVETVREEGRLTAFQAKKLKRAIEALLAEA